MALFKKKTTEQDNEERKLVEDTKVLYKNAYDSKASYHKTWDECFKAYTGELFKKNLPDYTSQEISNFVFSTIESIKPIMLADNPRFIVMPQKEELLDKANVVQSVMDYEWTRAKMFSHLIRSCTSGLIFGTVPIAIVWDKTAQNGLGDVKPIPISPFNFFVDPMATNIDDAEYCGYATYKHVGEVIKSFPDKAEQLKNSTSQPSDTYLSYGKTIDSNSSSKYVLYIELYRRDYSVDIEEFEEDGVKKQKSTMKYPNGRCIKVAGDVLLEDKENPYQDGKFPYVLWKCYDVPGKFWGMGEVEQIISPMQYHANLMNNILDSARLTANPIWILDKNSGVEKNSLTNRHGLVVRKNPGTDIKREQPPSLPAYIQNIVEKLEKHMEVIPGVYDVTRGERPSGITAGIAIQSLNESAQGRIKLKVQALEQMLSELGGMWLSRIQQFWYTKRNVRTIGADYKPTYNSIDKDDIDGDYDVVIVAGSTMPVNKTAKLQQLIQLAQTQAEDGLPVVDRKTMLENADLPNIEQILQRFDTLKQQQAQSQGSGNPPSTSITFKDLPIDGQIQLAQQAGIQISPESVQNKMAMEQQSAQQDAQLQQQNKLQQMDVQHQNNMEAKQTDQMMNMAQDQNALQQNGQDIQSKGNSGTDGAQLKEMIKYILSLNPQELDKLAQENPQVQKIVDMLQNMSDEELKQLQQELQSE